MVIILGYFIYKQLFIDTRNDEVNPLNISLIEAQMFSIESGVDTVLIGKQGTSLTIKKNSFTDCEGSTVKGKVLVELKEIYTGKDMILSGLTTMSDKQILESGGMLYINATQNGKRICINDTSFILVKSKKDNYKNGMKLFQGVANGKGNVNWTNPQNFLNDTVIIVKAIGSVPDSLSEMAALRLGIMARDTLIIVGNDTIYDSRSQYETTGFISAEIDSSWIEADNNFLKIQKTFQVKNFGYYNIDRFIEEFNTDNVRLSVNIKNSEAFNFINVRIALLDKKTYLEGYTMNNKRFVFGKNLNSNIVGLPLKDRAVILATSYSGSKIYFDYQKFTISREQEISLNLEESSIQKIEKVIDAL